MREYRNDDDTMRWVRRGGGLALLLLGWGFILYSNHFHISPAVVFICLAYFAGVAALYTLYRLGSTAVAANNEEDDAMSWVRPIGELEELEHEKRALLKAIKEAEFDHAMGKLSKADADAMVAIYRTRAIEVIKEIDIQNSLSGKVGSVRDRILREARARVEIETKAAPIVEKAKKKAEKGDKQKRSDKLADAVNAVANNKAEAKPSEAEAKTDDKPADDSKADDAKPDAPADAPADAIDNPAADTQSEAKSEAKEAAR
jgi:hypothetical protein